MTEFDFDAFVTKAQQAGASDVHIQTGHRPAARIHGEVVEAKLAKINHDQVRDIMGAVLDDRGLRQVDEQGSADRAHTIRQGRKLVCRLRVSFARCVEGYKVVCRLVPTTVPTIASLRLPKVFNNIADQLSGLVIVGGVTGAGKSTTIAAMIERINKQRAAHIVTLEDPIEFFHTPKKAIFTHREIGRDTPSFSDGLRTALRQDPDVLLVGEMRDLESIRHGLLAAETGHLVFTTVHSEAAGDIPERMISVFPEGEQDQVRAQVADVGLAFVAQQLVPRKTGKGRVAAHEVLILDAAARNLIRTKKSHQLDSVMQTQLRSGCTTMTRALIELFKAGAIDEEVLISHAPNKERARQYALEHVDLDTSQPSFMRRR